MEKLQMVIDWATQVGTFALKNPFVIIFMALVGALIWFVDGVGALKTVSDWIVSPMQQSPFELKTVVVKRHMINLSDRQGEAVGDVDYKVELRVKNISETRRIIREIKINGNIISTGMSFEPMQEFPFELKPEDIVVGLDALEVRTSDRVLKLNKKEAHAIQREFIQRKLAVAEADKKFKKAMLKHDHAPLKKPSDLMIDIVREIGYYEKATRDQK